MGRENRGCVRYFYGSNPEMTHVASALIPLLRTWSHGINLTARKLENVQSSNLVGHVPEGEWLVVSVSSLCCRQRVRQGVWSSDSRGRVGSGVYLGLGWEWAFWKYLGKKIDMGRSVCMVHTCMLCSIQIILLFFPIFMAFLQVRP